MNQMTITSTATPEISADFGPVRLARAMQPPLGRRMSGRLEEDTCMTLLVSVARLWRRWRGRWPSARSWCCSGTWIIREDAVGPGDQAVRAAAAVGPHHRARRRGGLSGAAAGAGLALRALALAVQGRSRCRWSSCSRARSRWSSPPTARRSRPSACSAREVACDNFQDARGVPAQRRRARPADRDPDRGHVPHQPGAVRRRHAGDARRRTA